MERERTLLCALFLTVLLSGCYLPPPPPSSYAKVSLLAPHIDIVFSSGRVPGGTRDRIFTMSRDGKYLSALAGTQYSRYAAGLAWSPDGGCIVFPRGLDAEEAETYGHTIALETLCSDSQEGLFIPGGSYGAWSPDESKFAYVLEESGELFLVVIDLSSGRVEWRVGLPKSSDDRNRLSWSPTGEWIVFGQQDPVEDWGIYMIDNQGEHLKRLTDGYEPEWSPVRAEIAFIDQDSLCLINEDGSERRCITSGGNDDWPSWSPDGEELVFQSARDGNGEIYRIRRDGSGLVRLTNDPEWDGRPSWKPATR
jgi:Tol biopolymer transport system component